MNNKLFLIPILLLLYLPLSAQDNINAIDKYFEKYVEDERFSVVYVSPRLFQLFENFAGEDLDLNDDETAAFMDMATDLRGLRILSTSTQPFQFFNDFKSKLDAEEYETLITVREKDGGKLEFFLRENADKQIEELLFFSVGEENFTLMSFVGPLKLEKIMRLANEIEKDH